MPNRGGFSWKRALGVTRAKLQLSRKIGIPLTKGGRQRKLGKALIGGSCLLPTIFLVLLVFGVVVSTVTAQPSYTIYLPLVLKGGIAPLPGENLQCNKVGNAEICATISDMIPNKNSSLTVSGRLLIDGKPQAGVQMLTTWHFKTVTNPCNNGITNNDGIAYCQYSIGGAASGYQVNIDVSISGHSVTTWFTTN